MIMTTVDWDRFEIDRGNRRFMLLGNWDQKWKKREGVIIK